MSDFLYYLNNHFILFVLCVSILVLLITTSRFKKKDKILLALIILSTLSLAMFEYFEIIFDKRYDYENIGRYIFSILCYVLRPTIIVLFFHIRFEFKNKIYYLVWLGVIVNALVYFSAIFAYHNPSMRFVFWYNESNHFGRTWVGYTVFFTCGLYLALLVFSSIVDTIINKTRKQINIMILITAGMAITAQIVAMVYNLETSYTTEAFVLGATLYFMYLNYENAANETIAYEREMQAKTTALMLSQIKPHFIYNTLATIQILCEIDPQKAIKTIEDFSTYLRANTDALSKTEPVMVSEEINHALAYSKIEMIRFQNVKVNFDIQDRNFKLPVLTIEPILENAIKYGVRGKEEGIVDVLTYKEENKHVLIIKDNGFGFIVDEVFKDEKIHVGVNNVRTRVINMVGGTFDIESVIGEGTTVTITVPDNQ